MKLVLISIFFLLSSCKSSGPKPYSNVNTVKSQHARFYVGKSDGRKLKIISCATNEAEHLDISTCTDLYLDSNNKPFNFYAFPAFSLNAGNRAIQTKLELTARKMPIIYIASEPVYIVSQNVVESMVGTEGKLSAMDFSGSGIVTDAGKIIEPLRLLDFSEENSHYSIYWNEIFRELINGTLVGNRENIAADAGRYLIDEKLALPHELKSYCLFDKANAKKICKPLFGRN